MTSHKKTGKIATKDSNDTGDFFQEYSGGSNTIRLWFVTFGIGGLYLLLTTDSLLKKLKEVNEIRPIAILFLLGIGVQLFVAILNKWINWYNYKFDGKYESRFPKFIEWLSNQFWVDIVCDIITSYCFGRIIWKMINVFSS